LHHADLPLGAPEHVGAVLELAGALTLAADGAQQLALGVEDLDLGKLPVQQVNVTLGIVQELGDGSEEDLLVVIAPAAPQLNHFLALLAMDGGLGIGHGGHAVGGGDAAFPAGQSGGGNHQNEQGHGPDPGISLHGNSFL